MTDGAKNIGDHYSVLGVARDAEPDAIKKAYRKLAREYHPDVAGDDPNAAKRFRQVQEAYEVLKDPGSRSRYDRRFQPRRPRMGPEGYRMPGGFHYRTAGQGSSSRMSRERFQSNTAGMEGIFGDFGFGDNQGSSGSNSQSRSRTAESEDFWRSGESARRADRKAGESTEKRTANRPGSDIRLSVNVLSSVAADGGTVELRYPRMRASDDGKSFHRYHEIYHLKVPPGTSSGDNLHCSRWGNAGPDGSCGDLICAVRVVADAPRSPRKGAPKARVEKGARSTRESRPEILPLAISLSEAVLGGRVQVTASDSVVMVTIPPLSSGGRRLRLKGKGRRGGDLFLELRVVMPTELDDESRSLMEQFAALNPYDPRGD